VRSEGERHCSQLRTPTGETVVTIGGTGFIGAHAVKFGTVAARSFVVNSGSSITAVSPAHDPGTVEIAVTTPLARAARPLGIASLRLALHHPAAAEYWASGCPLWFRTEGPWVVPLVKSGGYEAFFADSVCTSGPVRPRGGLRVQAGRLERDGGALEGDIGGRPSVILARIVQERLHVGGKSKVARF
jgi:hypothetical protein